MPNNLADVPLLTAEMAGNIRDFFRAIEPAESEYPEDDASDDAALDAIATGLSITKSAAAEEADRARIVALESALLKYGRHHDMCGKNPAWKRLGGACDCELEKALSGASENG